MPDITTRPSEPHRRTPSPELVSAVAHHEAGHAVAIVWAFRAAAWLPNPPPPLPVRYIEITDSAAGWSGNCFATDVYSMKWPIDCIAPRFRPLMEAQVVIELAGGVAEAVFRGEQRKHAILAFAVSNCAIDADLTRAAAVLSELRRLTGVRHDAQPFAERALRLTLANWCLHFEIRKGSTPVDPTQYLGGA